MFSFVLWHYPFLELFRATKSAWDFLGVNFWCRDFFWVLLEALGIFFVSCPRLLAPFDHPHRLKSGVPSPPPLPGTQMPLLFLLRYCLNLLCSTGCHAGVNKLLTDIFAGYLTLLPERRLHPSLGHDPRLSCSGYPSVWRDWDVGLPLKAPSQRLLLCR